MTRTSIGILVLLTTAVGAWAQESANLSPWVGQWIWHEEATTDAYVRQVIDVDKELSGARLAVTADNLFTLYINGLQIGHDSDWTSLENYDIRPYLKPGENVIAIHGSDPGNPTGEGISAILAEGALLFTDGSYRVFGTDGDWKIALSPEEDWTELDFDDSDWKEPQVYGKPPAGPWGGLPVPDFVPRARIEVVDADLPADAMPGDTLDVTLTVKPNQPLLRDGPVGIRLLSKGERVMDLYGPASVSHKEWAPGEATEVTIRGLTLPVYTPRTNYQVMVLAPSADGWLPMRWEIGDPPARPPVPVVHVEEFEVEIDDNDGIEFEAEVRVEGVGVLEATPFLLIRKGPELHRYVPFPNEVVRLERGDDEEIEEDADFARLPAGTYEVELRFHTVQTTGNLVQTVELGEVRNPADLEPMGFGTYRDRDGRDHFWVVNRKSTLLWDGQPYIPVGGMYLSTFIMGFNPDNPGGNNRAFENDVEKLTMLREAGVTDIYLNPIAFRQQRPRWVWQRIMDLFEEQGMRYGWQTTEHSRNPKAYHIAQEEFELAVTEAGEYTAEINQRWYTQLGHDLNVLYSLMDAGTGELLEVGKARTRLDDDTMVATVNLQFDGIMDGRLYFFPEFFIEGDYHDYWWALDEEYMGEIVDHYASFDLGPNFRHFIDPLDNEQSLRNMTRIIPSGSEFRAQLARWLKDRYGSYPALVSQWGLSPAPRDWREAAGLVPVGKPTADADFGYAYNPNTGFRTRVDLTVSQMWDDLLQYRDDSVRDYNNLWANALKTAQNVPIVHKLTDLESTTNNQTFGGMDGLGMEAYSAAPELIRGCGGGVYSRTQQAARTMWELVTETGRAAPDYIAYKDPYELVHELSSMVEMGARGTYVFYMNAAGDSKSASFYGLNLYEDPRQLWWLGCYSNMLKGSERLLEHEVKADFSFPAHRAGVEAFRRGEEDYHGDIASQSLPGYQNTWVVPAMDPNHLPPDDKMVFNLENSPITLRWGHVFERELESGRPVALVGLRLDRGTLSVDDYYTGEFAEREDGARVQLLDPPRGADITYELDEGVYGFRYENLEIYALDSWKEAVRTVSSEQPAVDFVAEVIGAKKIDRCRYFQGYRFRDWTYLWSMSGEEREIGVRVAGDAWAQLPDGTVTTDVPETVVLPANAMRPLVIRSAREPEFEGLEAICEDEAQQVWQQAVASARDAGFTPEEIGPKPETSEGIFQKAEELRERVHWASRSAIAHRKRAFVLDGDLGDWTDAQKLPFTVRVEQDQDFERVTPGSYFYVAWDDQGLVVGVHYQDEKLVNNNKGEKLWDGDAVEVFIETVTGDNKGHGQYDDDTRQFIFAPTNELGQLDSVVTGGPNFGRPRPPAFSEHAATVTEDGWNLEARIDYRDLHDWKPAPGQTIGFSVGVDDSDGGSRRLQVLWKGRRQISQNREQFGRLKLVQ